MILITQQACLRKHVKLSALAIRIATAIDTSREGDAKSQNLHWHPHQGKAKVQ